MIGIHALDKLRFTHNSERFTYMPCAKAFKQHGVKRGKLLLILSESDEIYMFNV